MDDMENGLTFKGATASRLGERSWLPNSSGNGGAMGTGGIDGSRALEWEDDLRSVFCIFVLVLVRGDFKIIHDTIPKERKKEKSPSSLRLSCLHES